MKRILIFSLVYYPRFVGGAEVALKEITDRISPGDMEFHMITLRIDADLPKEEVVGNIHIHRIGFSSRKARPDNTIPSPLSLNKYLLPFLGTVKALSLQRKYRFDAIWSSQANYAGFAALFFKFFKPRIPFFLTLQEGDPIEHYRKRVGFLFPLYKKIFSKADTVQTISHFLGDFASSMGHKGKPVIIPNGVDIALFSSRPDEPQLECLREKVGKREGDVLIVTASRLVEKNAVGDIISALSLLPGQVKLLILGTGLLEEELKRTVQSLGLESRVVFAGFISHREMPGYLHISDIFIRPSLSEGMGNSFIEAMAAGLPVIATPVGGIVDFLFDPERDPEKPSTGLFAEVKNPESIARQIKRLLGEPALREQIILNAQNMVFRSYDWSVVAKDMRGLVFEPFLR